MIKCELIDKQGLISIRFFLDTNSKKKAKEAVDLFQWEDGSFWSFADMGEEQEIGENENE